MMNSANTENLESLTGNGLTLYRITEQNAQNLFEQLEKLGNPENIIQELKDNYLPEYEDGKLKKFGFWTVADEQPVSFTLLEVDDYKNANGSTGADVLPDYRGKGLTPRAKPHLFYLGFVLLGLHRIVTGHAKSNLSSQRSIEKTPGLKFEGILRESTRASSGGFEDELTYSILEPEYKKLYNPNDIKAVYS